MHDNVNLEGLGIPTVSIATTAFVSGAESQGESLGFEPDMFYVDHPVQNRTDAELKTLARNAVDGLLAQLVATDQTCSPASNSH